MRGLGRDPGSEAPRELVDAAHDLAGVAALVEREARQAGVTLEHLQEGEPPKLVALRDHLHQVVLNLTLNAVHATPEGGRVTVRTAATPDGDGVTIEVADTGAGIPEEHLARIFDPFFTTKDPDEGTGLGLMICHQLVADHGGTIEVRSAGGQGSTFSVRLPAGGAAVPGDDPLERGR
jgi:signal transduction histidine kinase